MFFQRPRLTCWSALLFWLTWHKGEASIAWPIPVTRVTKTLLIDLYVTYTYWLGTAGIGWSTELCHTSVSFSHFPIFPALSAGKSSCIWICVCVCISTCVNIHPHGPEPASRHIPICGKIVPTSCQSCLASWPDLQNVVLSSCFFQNIGWDWCVGWTLWVDWNVLMHPQSFSLLKLYTRETVSTSRIWKIQVCWQTNQQVDINAEEKL